MLERLGLDGLTAAVYKRLMSGRHHSAEGLADHLGRPVDEVVSALGRLEKLDLLHPVGEGIGRLVDPRLGLQALLFRQMAGIESRLREFEEDRAAVLALVDRYADRFSEVHRAPGDDGGSECLSGREAVAGRLRDLAEAVGSEWLAFLPGGVPGEWLETAQALERQVRGRGVATRTVSTDSVRSDTRGLHGDGWSGGLGCPVRTVPSLPVPMVIADRACALLPSDPADPWRGVVQLTAPGALEALVALFEGVWEQGVPLGTSTQPDEHGLSPREKELLRLLARGLNDDVIGRRLGVSLRTVRRIVADLCVRLRAASRFEAGYQAAKRGWI